MENAEKQRLTIAIIVSGKRFSSYLSLLQYSRGSLQARKLCNLQKQPYLLEHLPPRESSICRRMFQKRILCKPEQKILLWMLRFPQKNGIFVSETRFRGEGITRNSRRQTASSEYGKHVRILSEFWRSRILLHQKLEICGFL